MTPAAPPNLNAEYYILNGDYYTFNVYIVNQDQRIRNIAPRAIKSLVLEDSFDGPFHAGHIIVENTFDILERTIPGNTPNTHAYYAPQPNSVSQSLGYSPGRGFIFKGDARDILKIEIMPVLPQSPTGNADDLAKSVFFINLDLAIYNEEEILDSSVKKTKYKKLYFWDICYELLREKNIPFSTANLIPTGNTPLNQLSNEDRAVPTGIAIAELLKQVYPTTDYNVVINNDDFDPGISKIFFSAPASYKALDSLRYINEQHVSTNGSDSGNLNLDRYTRAFGLSSIKTYFDQAYNAATDSGGPFYLETYYIENLDNNAQQTAFTLQKVDIKFAPFISVFLDKYATIDLYSFNNAAGLYTQSGLASYIVHSYDYSSKTFNLEGKANGAKQCLQTYQNNYVASLKGAAGGPVPNMVLGNYREQNVNVNNIFSPVQNQPLQRLAWGQNRFLFNSINQNNMISFRVKGSTHRQAGRFIGIDTKHVPTPIPDMMVKLLGIYLIVECTHIFSGDEYWNELKCIKTYNYQQVFKNTKGII
jgi:hypothetical protein